MKNTKVYLLILTSVIIGMILSITISYTLAETIIDSKNVYYKDNSNLLADNVQDAIDGTCTKFESKVDNFLDKIYPVGSIYITTTLSTTEQVKEALGGEWAVYGDGRTLLSSSGKSEQTGGANTVTLTTDNLPSHSHSFTPAGSVASTFKGTAVTSGTQSANHTHTFSGTTSSNGAHTHTMGVAYDGDYAARGGGIGSVWPSPVATTSSAGAHTHTFSGTTSANSANHTHSVTAAGTVTSTFTGTASNTGSTGGGKSFSVQDAYITVYMYKRTK